MIDGGTTAAIQPAKSNAKALRLPALNEGAFGLSGKGTGDLGILRLSFKALAQSYLCGLAPCSRTKCYISGQPAGAKHPESETEGQPQSAIGEH
jgi:hypothetical protein